MKKITLLTAGLALLSSLANAQILYYTESSTGLNAYKWEFGKAKLKFVDANADGNMDIASLGDHGSPNWAGSTVAGVMVYKGNGAGTWTASKSGTYGYGGLDFGDVNNDGKIDVAMGMHHFGTTYGGPSTGLGSNLEHVALGNGTGNSWTDYSTGLASKGETYGMFGTALGDMNNDGKLDVAFSTFGFGNGIQVYLNAGSGTWTWTDGASSGNFGDNIGIMWANLDNDGYLDLVTAWEVAMTNINTKDGKFNKTYDTQAGLRLGMYEYFSGISVGDVNHDGADDIAYVSDSVGLRVKSWDYKNTKWKDLTGNLPAFSTYYSRTALADMDGDGNLDLVAFNTAATIDIFLGDGNGNWTADYQIPVGGSLCNDMVVADATHDGYPDIAVLTEVGGKNALQFFTYTSSTAATLSIKGINPSGGQCFQNNTVVNLDWNSGVPTGQSSTIKLEFSSTGANGPWTAITNSTPNNGHYQWSIDATTSSGNCYIKYTVTSGSNSQSFTSNQFGIGAGCSTIGITEANNENESSFIVYPNPSNGIFNIAVSDIKGNANVSIYDVLGNVVYSESLKGNDKYVINMQNKAKGVYFVKLVTENGKMSTQKITVH